ncbi:MAG: glycosyltransferase [Flavisolibacter sp.]
MVFLFVYALLIFRFKKSWDGLEEFHLSGNSNHTFLSVLIPARNEESTITQLLNAINEQTYPKDRFEVIVIDDFSTDHTVEKVKSFSSDNLFLIQPSCSAEKSSKKKAIESGVEFAKGELIITTDADCVPDPLWLETINQFYIQKQSTLIASPVKYVYDFTILGIFQSLDFLTLQGITAASVASRSLTLCNGANLAYTKYTFEEVNGFKGIDHIATGDDLLLMYKIYSKGPEKVQYLKSKTAIVSTSPMHSWKQFISQRKRWGSKSFIYKDQRILWVLAFVYMLNLLFIILLAYSFFHPAFWLFSLAYLLFKSLIEWRFVNSVARFYNEQALMKYFILFQPLHILYTVAIGIISQVGTYEWKGRRTK